MNIRLLQSILRSWKHSYDDISGLEQIIGWIEGKNNVKGIVIRKLKLSQCGDWRYETKLGGISNQRTNFFSICGIELRSREEVQLRQPIILQEEIGYLGIICKEFDGVLHFLMQAKIEPGNVNKIQISPTIQATKSNFTQRHGGRKPAYLDYFINARDHEIIVDQIQSEQSSRFYKKRNRNIIIRVEENIEVLPSHRWMTLGQIKQLMKHDNLVNMDTRTVLSCIPFSISKLDEEQKKDLRQYFKDEALFRSIFDGDGINHLPEIYQYVNNYKMFDEGQTRFVPLYEMESWEMREKEFVCKNGYPFKIVFCDIAIEGREVKRWTQPLFEAVGMATFGLVMCNIDGVKEFLVCARSEIGCFDKLELGPTVQLEATEDVETHDAISAFFAQKHKEERCVRHDVILSEEGGRFYHEQNHNVIIEVCQDEIPPLPDGYFLVDYKTLNTLVQVNNCLNIQLRNLLSLLEA